MGSTQQVKTLDQGSYSPHCDVASLLSSKRCKKARGTFVQVDALSMRRVGREIPSPHLSARQNDVIPYTHIDITILGPVSKVHRKR